jgi:HD-GYP domain-containing protein (c-di-GMP phosphodiesterase class II)
VDISRREVRISVQGVTEGMFVSRLDRPWLEIPFPIQGMKVTSDEQIFLLLRACSHVWIDISAGRAPDLRYLVLDEPEVVRVARAEEELAALRRTTWEIENDLETELRLAKTAHTSLAACVEEVMDDLRRGVRLDLAKLKDGVEAMIDSILRNPTAFAWLKELKRRDNYSYQHAMGCAIWSASFGRHLGLERFEVRNLALGGLLCDIGMTRVPLELLARQGPLGADEAGLIRRHVQHGLELVVTNPDLPPGIAEMVATHHERHDGSGYPNGLRGSEIPIFGRIMGVVDSYDAMTCLRPYARGRSPHEAVSELYQQRGTLFQTELVEQFIQSCGIYPTGSLVELSNGQVGVVTEVHSLKRLRPRVMLLLDASKQPLERFREVDLGEMEEADAPLTVKQGLPPGAYGIDPSELFLD